MGSHVVVLSSGKCGSTHFGKFGTFVNEIVVLTFWYFNRCFKMKGSTTQE